MNRTAKCGNCAYWIKVNAHKKEGRCIKYASPEALEEIVYSHDWCYDWEKGGKNE